MVFLGFGVLRLQGLWFLGFWGSQKFRNLGFRVYGSSAVCASGSLGLGG